MKFLPKSQALITIVVSVVSVAGGVSLLVFSCLLHQNLTKDGAATFVTYLIPVFDGVLLGLLFGYFIIQNRSLVRNMGIEIIKTKRNEENYRAIFDFAHDAILIFDIETGALLDANKQALTMIETTLEELQRSLFDRFSCKEEGYTFELALEKMRLTVSEGAQLYDWKARRKSGEEFWAQIGLKRAVIDGSEKAVAFVRDVTSQKKAEVALAEKEHQYRETSQMLESLINAIPDIIGVQDINHKVVKYNLAGYNFLNVPQDSVINKPCFSLVGRDMECEDCATALTTATKRPAQAEKYFKEFDTWFDVRSYPVFDKQGDIVRVIAHMRDITSEKKKEETIQRQVAELKLLNEKLQEKSDSISIMLVELEQERVKAARSDQLKSDFLANMSHEIRTPMNGIIGFSEILPSVKDDPKKVQYYSEIVNKSCRQLLSIVNEILDISKIETGNVEVTHSLWCLNELMRDLFTFFKTAAEEKKLDLVCEHTAMHEESLVCSDRQKIQQIMTNLIANAIKFTSHGTIEFGYRVDSKRFALFVQDTGIGISDEELKTVFERYKQASKSRGRYYSGTGLGLPISKAFAEMLGGTISAELREGRGSCFTITLPLVEDESAVSERITKPKISKDFKWKQKKLLIVEDERINRIYLQEILADTEITLYFAESVAEAVSIFSNEHEIDLVLMDIVLPDGTGYEATKKLKAIRPDTPIIAQTACAMANECEKALLSGCSEYLTKPIERAKFLHTIEKFLS